MAANGAASGVGSDAKRVVLVTGCSSGIGRALADAFRDGGQRCFASARSEAAIAALTAAGHEVVSLDVTDPGSIRKAVASVIERAGRIDILVNNAGMSLFAPLAEVPLDDVRRMLETNLVGPLALVQAVFPHMAERRSGRIVNVGSMVGVVPTPWVGAYAGAKAGLHTLSEALRMELRPFGIEVVVVQPGGVRSEVAAKAPRHSQTPHYAAVSRHIERRADASQTSPMAAEEFARRTVAAVTRERAPRTLRIGRGTLFLGILDRLPTRLRDRLFRRAFGLDALQRAAGRSGAKP